MAVIVERPDQRSALVIFRFKRPCRSSCLSYQALSSFIAREEHVLDRHAQRAHFRGTGEGQLHHERWLKSLHVEQGAYLLEQCAALLCLRITQHTQ